MHNNGKKWVKTKKPKNQIYLILIHALWAHMVGEGHKPSAGTRRRSTQHPQLLVYKYITDIYVMFHLDEIT